MLNAIVQFDFLTRQFTSLFCSASLILVYFSMNTLLGYQSKVSTIRRQVRGAMEIALFIQNLQEERAEVALFIFTKQTDAKFLSTQFSIQERFSQTDRALEEGMVLNSDSKI